MSYGSIFEKRSRSVGSCRCGAYSPNECQGRGGCDEFWEYARQAQTSRNTVTVYPPTDKQISFMNVLLKKKEVSAELLAQVEGAKASKAKASTFIDALLKCADKPKVGA